MRKNAEFASYLNSVAKQAHASNEQIPAFGAIQQKSKCPKQKEDIRQTDKESFKQRIEKPYEKALQRVESDFLALKCTDR